MSNTQTMGKIQKRKKALMLQARSHRTSLGAVLSVRPEREEDEPAPKDGCTKKTSLEW